MDFETIAAVALPATVIAILLAQAPHVPEYALGLLGVAILMSSLAPLLLVPLFAVVVQWEFIRVEERMLDARFGGEWGANGAKVRQWI